MTLTPAAATPTVASESYILMDAATGAVLAEKNADLRLPPASLTKILSVYLIFEALRDGRMTMEQSVRISENAWGSNVAGSKMFLELNSEVAVRDLLRGVIVQSGNDASVALAEALAGDEAAFADEMNRTAARLGLDNSRFQSATGLPRKKQYTSARDVAVVVRRTVLDFPEWYPMYAEREYTHNNISQPNRNRLLASFAGADGVKTGYTKKAGYCLASSAVRDGRRLIAVVMKAKSPRQRVRESAKLLTYGFNQFKNARLFSSGDERELRLWEGTQKTVRVRPAADGVYTVRRDKTMRARFRPTLPLVAPIAVGDIVGTIEVLDGDDVTETVNVVAAEAVAAAGFLARMRDHIKINYLGHGDDSTVLSEW